MGGRRPEVRGARETGLLDINTNPWSTVFVDGRPIGTTPIQGYEVSAGRHRLRFENPSLSAPGSAVVEVGAGARERVIENLR